MRALVSNCTAGSTCYPGPSSKVADHHHNACLCRGLLQTAAFLGMCHTVKTYKVQQDTGILGVPARHLLPVMCNVVAVVDVHMCVA
jgi:hypothetical protein